MNRHILQQQQKALEINLDKTIYGSFAEIGAGQEVARNFFKAGAAAGTIAKTMSAYDKDFSDAIYGKEESGRYVCQSRLNKMLDHEVELMDERLTQNRPDTKFFVFADTVSAINYQRTIKGQGWMGVRFQLTPTSGYNDLILHVNMKDRDNGLQQEAIGLLGVNMIYACYFEHEDMSNFIQSLLDGIEGRVEIDMLSLKGPDFMNVDNRLLSLYLVKHGLTEVAIFDQHGESIHGSEFLYKKSLMVVRGHYRPPTLVTVDALESSFEQFIEDPKVQEKSAILLSEITLDNLLVGDEIDEVDFLERMDAINALNQKVIISNCSNHQKLINYLSDFKIKKLGLVIGVLELMQIINDKFYKNQDGRLLVAFGELFTRNIKIYVYPALHGDDHLLMDVGNMPVPDGIRFLYKHLIDSKQIVPVIKYNPDILTIFPSEVLAAIKEDKEGWRQMVSSKLVQVIEQKGLFNYPNKKLEFEY